VIKRLLRKIKHSVFPKPKIIYHFNTYSQAGEDAILAFLFADKKMNSVTYLDIGTSTPDTCNNTYLLYTKGNTGVCVEADKSLIPIIQKTRPKDKVINVGVSVSDAKEDDFFIFDIKGLNTFDKTEAEKRSASGLFKITEVVKVPLASVNKIIKENFVTYPDFLSIDIEGLDLDVLKSLDFNKFPIPVICVETCTYSENHIRSKDSSIEMFLISKGYEVYADTYINAIFVNKNWFYKV
jgi:FkbM family methyltransferase